MCLFNSPHKITATCPTYPHDDDDGELLNRLSSPSCRAAGYTVSRGGFMAEGGRLSPFPLFGGQGVKTATVCPALAATLLWDK